VLKSGKDKRFGISLTVDVESYSTDGKLGFARALHPLLTALETTGISGTFFVNGEVIDDYKHEIVKLQNNGHEVGLHGYSHRYLDALGEIKAREELRRGFMELGDLLGNSPLGFRAPYFSVTPSTPWASHVIKETGFCYSSSVLPCSNPQAGFPGAPRQPFFWDNGLLEFPSPVSGLGQWCLPTIGGGYLRVLPSIAVKVGSYFASKQPGNWTYCHPYDFDESEAIPHIENNSKLLQYLLGARRQLMLPRILNLLSPESRPLGELAVDKEFLESVPKFILDQQNDS
jgi:hypothetical protein